MSSSLLNGCGDLRSLSFCFIEEKIGPQGGARWSSGNSGPALKARAQQRVGVGTRQSRVQIMVCQELSSVSRSNSVECTLEIFVMV